MLDKIAEKLAGRTVWIIEDPIDSGYIAFDLLGNVVGRHKFKSTLEFIVLKKIREKEITYDCVAIVVKPSNRKIRGPWKNRRRCR